MCVNTPPASASVRSPSQRGMGLAWSRERLLTRCSSASSAIEALFARAEVDGVGRRSVVEHIVGNGATDVRG